MKPVITAQQALYIFLRTHKDELYTPEDLLYLTKKRENILSIQKQLEELKLQTKKENGKGLVFLYADMMVGHEMLKMKSSYLFIELELVKPEIKTNSELKNLLECLYEKTMTFVTESSKTNKKLISDLSINLYLIKQALGSLGKEPLAESLGVKMTERGL